MRDCCFVMCEDDVVEDASDIESCGTKIDAALNTPDRNVALDIGNMFDCTFLHIDDDLNAVKRVGDDTPLDADELRASVAPFTAKYDAFLIMHHNDYINRLVFVERDNDTRKQFAR